MKTSISNYRVEIALEGRVVPGVPAHEQMVSAGAELAGRLARLLGIEVSRVSLVWDAYHWCENCGDELDQVSDERECYCCGRLMCRSCNCNTNDIESICLGCWGGE